jgi:hypothetical protein
MVRNGYWLWYEIAILWYEMVNYGTKWLWCKIHMVRNCNFVVRNGKHYDQFVPGDTKQSRLESTKVYY